LQHIQYRILYRQRHRVNGGEKPWRVAGG